MTTKRGVAARGAAIGVVTVVGERAVAFVVVLVLARVLAPEDFGRYGYVLAGLALVQVLVDQGVEVAAVALRSAEPGRGVLRAILGWRAAVWALVALPVGGLVLPALGGASGVSAAAGLAASLLVLVGPSITVRSLRRARGDLAGMARVAFADAAFGGAAVIATATAALGLGAVFAARAGASLLVSAVALLLEPRRPVREAASPATMGSLVPVAGPLAASALLIAVQTRAGHLVAMSLAGPAVVALLAAAARAAEVLGVLPEGALLALFPRMAARPSDAGRLAAGAARSLAAIVLAPVVFLSGGGGWLASTLFGAAYADAGGAVAILAWGALLSVTGGLALHALVARGMQRSLVAANAVAAAGGVALQAALVGRFGLEGAAIATVATALLGQVTLLALPATRGVVARVWRSVLPLAGLAAGIAVLAGQIRPDALGGVAAVAAYGGLAVASGMVGRREWLALREALGRRG